MDLKEQEVLGDRVGAHWYYSSKAAAMRAYLSKRHYRHVIDVGAGSGFFSKYLLAEGSADRATCVDTGYDHDWSETVAGRPISYVRACEGADADLLLFMDVLEHVPDDVALLKQYVDGAPPQAEVFISVPAFQFLWSSHDSYLGHYRRYTISMMRETVSNARLHLRRCTYYFGFVFPLAACRRLARRYVSERANVAKSDLQLHSTPVNAGLKLLCVLERPFMRLNKVAGLSVFCSAVKA